MIVLRSALRRSQRSESRFELLPEIYSVALAAAQGLPYCWLRETYALSTTDPMARVRGAVEQLTRRGVVIVVVNDREQRISIDLDERRIPEREREAEILEKDGCFVLVPPCLRVSPSSAAATSRCAARRRRVGGGAEPSGDGDAAATTADEDGAAAGASGAASAVAAAAGSDGASAASPPSSAASRDEREEQEPPPLGVRCLFSGFVGVACFSSFN